MLSDVKGTWWLQIGTAGLGPPAPSAAPVAAVDVGLAPGISASNDAREAMAAALREAAEVNNQLRALIAKLQTTIFQ